MIDFAGDIDRLTPVCFGLLGLCVVLSVLANAVARRRVINGGLIYLAISAAWFVARLNATLAIVTEDPTLHGELVRHLFAAFALPTFAAIWFAYKGWATEPGATSYPNRNAIIVAAIVVVLFAWVIRFAD